jgi:hypothetical protein
MAGKVMKSTWRVSPGGVLTINALAAAVCHVSSWLSLCRLCFIKDRGLHEERQWAIHVYVLAWMGGLLWLLVSAPMGGWWPFLAPGIAFYRLQDLLLSSMVDALSLRSTFGKYDSRARVLIVLVNVVQLVVIFAIAYRYCLDTPVSKAFKDVQDLNTPFNYLFLSWANLPPLGSGNAPLTFRARVLSMAETASALLLVVMALSAFLGKAAED